MRTSAAPLRKPTSEEVQKADYTFSHCRNREGRWYEINPKTDKARELHRVFDHKWQLQPNEFRAWQDMSDKRGLIGVCVDIPKARRATPRTPTGKTLPVRPHTPHPTPQTHETNGYYPDEPFPEDC